MVDLLAPDAPHDVALLGDAAACRTASSGARYGGTREHMSLSQGDHMSMERRRAQEPVREVLRTREHMSLTGPIPRLVGWGEVGWGGGRDKTHCDCVGVL